MKVSTLLPLVKANRYTYHNIPKSNIMEFKKAYNKLKEHKEKETYSSIDKKVYQWLNSEKEISFLKKYRAIELVLLNLNYTGF